jgi:hypothetical protein
MSKEEHGVDPLSFAIASEQFFVEVDVPFSVNASGGMLRAPFDGAVDAFIAEVFVNIAFIAGDSRFGCPAVNVPAEGIRGICEQVHGWLSDAFHGGPTGAMVCADEVPFAGK